MSEVLLDTHAFLWYVFKDSRLSRKALRTIAKQDTLKMLSMASLWEIVIKTQLGKLGLGTSIEQFLERYVKGRQIEVLPIDLADLLVYSGLPMHHADPFDRLLIAQATRKGTPIVTSDARFSDYAIKTLW